MNAPDPPDCADCAHCWRGVTCQRPVPSYWNAATNQRRSRLHVGIAVERSDARVFAASRLARQRCGPAGIHFFPRFEVAEA